jgi:hypothetical protein
VTRKTAWLVRRKIIEAMARGEGGMLLRGVVELAEGYIGGRRPAPESRGRRQPGKALVAMAAEHTQGGGLGRAPLRVTPDAGAKSLSAAALATIAPGSVVQTDGWAGYAGLEGAA